MGRSAVQAGRAQSQRRGNAADRRSANGEWLHAAALVMDDHLAAPRSGLTGLDGHSAINRAIGVLIERGATPEAARAEVRRLASLDGGNPQHGAEQVLRSISDGSAADGSAGEGG